MLEGVIVNPYWLVTFNERLTLGGYDVNASIRSTAREPQTASEKVRDFPRYALTRCARSRYDHAMINYPNIARSILTTIEMLDDDNFDISTIIRDLLIDADSIDFDHELRDIISDCIKSLTRDELSMMRLEYSLCPYHATDYAICFDDDDDDCAQIRAIFPSHDT